MIDAPIPQDTTPHAGESQEKKDDKGWSVAPVDERDLNYMKMREERGAWSPVDVARAFERFRPEPGGKVVVIGRSERGGPAEHLDLFAAIRKVAEEDWFLNKAGDYHPKEAVAMPAYPTPDELGEFLRRNSREGGYMRDWSASGGVPYVELDGNADMGVAVIGVMDATAKTRTEMVCTFPTTLQ